MENKILKYDTEMDLYLVSTNDIIAIVNNRISNKPHKNYKYWEYRDNQNFSIKFDDIPSKKLFGEALLFTNTSELNKENYEFVYDLILNAMKSSKENNIFDVLNIIEKYFRNIYSLVSKEELQGLFAEFLFLKYMQENSFDIQENYHKNDKSNFDFYFKKTNKYVELKSAINDIHDYNVSYKQIDYDPDNTFLVTINLWPDENGINFLELLDQIKFTNPELIEKVNFYKKSFTNDLFIKEEKYDIKQYKINFYPGNNLPSLTFSKEYTLNIKNIKYDISTIGLKKISLEEFINKIF